MRILLFIIILALLSFGGGPTQARSLTLNQQYDYLLFTFGETYYILSKDTLYSTKDEENWTKTSHSEIPYFIEIRFVTDGKTPYLFDIGGSNVYLLRNDSIIKINEPTFRLRNQFGSYNFLHDNKIFTFGGYGLFTYKNIITYYDLMGKGWDIFMPETPAKHWPKERFHSKGKFTDSIMYIYAGSGFKEKAQFSYQDLEELNDVWRFDFRNLRWKKLGETSLHITYIRHIFFEDFHNNSLLLESTDKLNEFTKAHLIDVENNLVNTYRVRSNKIMLYQPKDHFHHITYNNNSNKFLLLRGGTHVNYRTEFIPLDEVIAELLETRQFYKPEEPTLRASQWLMVSIILLGLLGGYFLRRKKLQSHSGSLINPHEMIQMHLEKVREQLSNHELQILNILLAHYPEPVQYPTLMQIYEANLSYESQIKKLRTNLGELNASLKILLRTNQEVIITKRNEFDKRIKEVFIAGSK